MRTNMLMLTLLSLLAACSPSADKTAQQAEQALPGQGQDTGKTVIYRDTYGIPHIYAPTVADGLYAQGWAQAQDRPTQLLLNFKIAMGELSEVNGESGVPTSLVAHMFGHMANSATAITAMSEQELQRITAFANGITDYYRANPADVPQWWRHDEVTPQMVDAFGRAFLYNWSIDEALGDLQRGGITPAFVTEQRGSNQWAVAPSRTADGHAMLLIDPHLSWWGVSRFWEMRIHAGELHGSGVALAGSPYIGLGHNSDVAWAMTTGGPDTADVYRLTLHPDNPQLYLYDGEYREISQHTVAMKFPDGSTSNYTWESSHHGPVVARADGYAYAARIAYDSGTNRNRAWEALNFAKDYTGAVDACASLALFPQNVMVADTSGNIYYQRTGRVPVRDTSFDWSLPVDGSVSATEWQGFHPSSDHLQVLNPESGYMQNCNIPPDAMIPDSPFKLANQPDYLFASKAYGDSRDGWTNQRGARAIELLSQDADVTIEEALAYAVDIEPYGHERWLNVLRQAAPPASTELDEMLAWQGQLHKDSTEALRYYYWRNALSQTAAGTEIRSQVDDYYAIVEGRGSNVPALNEVQLDTIRAAWQSALDQLGEHFGTTDVAWGRVFRVGRDSETWPVSGGGEKHLGLTTLRSMGYADADESHQRHGNRGQTSTQLVVLSKPIRSWVYLPVGQSDRPESPHYRDQAQTVFANRTLKPSWWLPEDLAEHIVTRTEMTPRY